MQFVLQEKNRLLLIPMADLERLMKTESATTTEKKRSSTNLLPFLVKVENVSSRLLQRCRDQEKSKKIKNKK